MTIVQESPSPVEPLKEPLPVLKPNELEKIDKDLDMSDEGFFDDDDDLSLTPQARFPKEVFLILLGRG